MLRASGEVAEWFKAAVLKTVVPLGTGGSNPSLSANFLTRGINPRVRKLDNWMSMLKGGENPQGSTNEEAH